MRLLLLSLAALFFVPMATAQTSPWSSTQTEANCDVAELQEGDADSNFGTLVTMKLRFTRAYPTPQFSFLIKFNEDLSANTFPVIAEARIYMRENIRWWLFSSGDELTVSNCESSWDEDTVTWNSAPLAGTRAITYNHTELTAFSPLWTNTDPEDLVYVDVTALVQAQRDGTDDPADGFLFDITLDADGTSIYQLDSDDSGTVPYLWVTSHAEPGERGAVPVFGGRGGFGVGPTDQ